MLEDMRELMSLKETLPTALGVRPRHLVYCCSLPASDLPLPFRLQMKTNIKGVFDAQVCTPFEAASHLNVQLTANAQGTSACACASGNEVVATTCYKDG